MTGKAICRLMRCNHLSIRALAGRLGVSQARVRQVRTQGLSDPYYIRDWTQAITGA